MTSTLTRLPATVHYCRERLQQYLLAALPLVFDAVDDELFTLADRAQTNQDQNHYFEAMREIRLRRRAIEAGIVARITERFAFAVQTDDEGSGVVEYKQELCAALVTAIIFRTQEKVAPVLHQISRRLSERVPVAVTDATNPFSPSCLVTVFAAGLREELCEELRAELSSHAVDAHTLSLLLTQFECHVLGGYTAFLHQINTELKNQGVLPELDAIALEQTEALGAGTAILGQPVGDAGDLYRLLDDLQLAASMEVQAAIDPEGSLLASQHSWVNSVLSTPVATATATTTPTQQHGAVSLLELIDQHLQHQHVSTLRVVDRDLINLVALLFEFILDDRNLPMPMKTLIGHMRIPLLKVALSDQTLFNTNTHPARLLLNQMATVALGWQGSEWQSADYQNTATAPIGEQGKDHKKAQEHDVLYAEISRIILRLLQEFNGNIDLFDELRSQLSVFVGKEQRRIAVVEQRTLDAEDGKAKTEVARQRVAEALALAVSGQRIPLVVAELLQGPWSNVLFFIYLQQGENSSEWQWAMQVTDDLLWSVTPLKTHEERNRLILLLPDLLQRLRQGLAQVACHPAVITELLQRLEATHLQQFTGGYADDELKLFESPELPQVANTRVELSSNKVSDGVNTEVSTMPLVDQRVDEKFVQIVEQLSQGCWFELQDSTGLNHRCRLAAIIKSADKYIFTNRSGMKVAEKNRTQLILALQQGELRQLDDSGLFDRALESVIGNLRQSKHSL